jgi:hypothetical protein
MELMGLAMNKILNTTELGDSRSTFFFIFQTAGAGISMSSWFNQIRFLSVLNITSNNITLYTIESEHLVTYCCFLGGCLPSGV